MNIVDKHQEYLLRLALAKGHARFGKVGVRKEPDDAGGDEGGGAADFSPTGHAHPLLSKAAQFSGDFNEESPVVSDNPIGEKQLQLLFEARLEAKKQAEQKFNPSFSR